MRMSTGHTRVLLTGILPCLAILSLAGCGSSSVTNDAHTDSGSDAPDATDAALDEGPADAGRDAGTTGDNSTGDDGQADLSDMEPLDTGPDVTRWDTTDDHGRDEGLPDIPADGDAGIDDGQPDTPDTFFDSPPDPGDSEDIAECPELDCNIDCPKGFKTDGGGCPTCRCRECGDMQDCFGLADFMCDNPICTSGGDCTCDCGEFADHNYVCPDGTVICMGRCSDSGVTFMHDVEQECPTLCQAGRTIDLQCPDGLFQPWCECRTDDCRPECRNIGTPEEGWYQPCSGEALMLTKCQGHQVFCDKIGSKSEGWYDTAGNRLSWTVCSPAWACRALSDACSSLECSGSEPSGQINCPDGRSSQFCSCTRSGAMECPANPQATCGNHWRGCARAGEFLRTDAWLQCCPGTLRLRPIRDIDGTCVPDDTNPAGSCSECGDGLCESPEDRCNCPEDCLDGLFPGYPGSPCLRDTECPPDLVCGNPSGHSGFCVAGDTRRR